IPGRLEIVSNDPSTPRVTLALTGMGAGGSGGGGTQALTSGVPASGSAGAPPAGQGVLATTQYTIQAPCAPAELRITLSGNQDVDLFVSINQRISVSVTGRPSANFSSSNSGGNESLIFSNGTALPGTYYIAVGNFGPGAASFTVTATLILNPTPVITALSPPAAQVGGDAFVLAVNGRNFVPGSVARWNDRERLTSWSSSQLLRAAVSAADLAAAGTSSVTVSSPAPGGGLSAPASFIVGTAASSVSAASFTGNQPGESLALESIAAAFGRELAIATEAATTVPLPTTLAGTRVTVRDTAGVERAAPLFFISPSQINYQIPPGAVAGNATFVITSGDGKAALGNTTLSAVAPGIFSANADGQGVAAGVALRVRPDNPLPAITSLSPTAAAVGGAAFTLTVNGTNFLPESVVRLNSNTRATTFVSATRLMAAISAADIAAAGSAAITVVNPAPGGGTSNAVNLPINNPSPSLSSLSHAMTTSGGPGFTLTVNGSRFLPASVVRWNGMDRATTFVSDTRLMAEIPASDLVAPGAAQVTVFNPPPGGGASSSARIDIFDGSRDIRLTSGVASTGTFNPSPVNACSIQVFPQYTIVVPAGATRLQITLTGTVEVDLFARYGQRVDFPSTIIADYRSTAGFNSESITVT
ncbi:MAG: IPT/TIG domain-containing protein, partial [Blastocatellia bacterium]